MRPLIFVLLIFLIGCGERPDQNMKCDNGSNEYVNCTPDVIRRILKKCKENNMSYIHMVYESSKETSSVYCNAFETIEGEKYWNIIPTQQGHYE